MTNDETVSAIVDHLLPDLDRDIDDFVEGQRLQGKLISRLAALDMLEESVFRLEKIANRKRMSEERDADPEILEGAWREGIRRLRVKAKN